MNKKVLITILTILGLAVVTGGFWYVQNQQKENVVIKTEQDQNQQMNNEKENENQNQEEQKGENNKELDFEKIDTSNWKEYCNKEYGFCVKYPEGWNIIFKGNNLVISPIGDKKINYNILIISIKKNSNIEKFANDYGRLSPEFNGEKLSRIIDRNIYNGNNFDGEKMVGTTDIGINKKIIITLKEDNMFIFSYNDINLQRNEIENIISTFKFMQK